MPHMKSYLKETKYTCIGSFIGKTGTIGITGMTGAEGTESFLFPGGRSSGGRQFGIAYFSSAL